MKTIDRPELDEWTSQRRPFALINVLPGCSGSAQSAPATAQFLDASESFMAQVTGLGDDKEQPVILYESTTAAVSVEAAAEVLGHAGFTNVYHFVGPQSALYNSGHDSRTD